MATNLAKAEKEKQMGLCAKMRVPGETRPEKQRVGKEWVPGRRQLPFMCFWGKMYTEQGVFKTQQSQRERPGHRLSFPRVRLSPKDMCVGNLFGKWSQEAPRTGGGRK